MNRSLSSFVAILAITVTACLATASLATARTASRWPASAERSFLANCKVTSHGNATGCRCELRWLEARYSLNQIGSMYLHDKSRLLRTMVRAATACR
jgi:hypothetical protein